MLALAALMLATASADASPALTTTAPWWEKIIYTFADNGGQSCRYETSLSAGPQACGTDPADMAEASASSSDGTFTKITIERRFTPAGESPEVAVATGETLLGGQVMTLAIDGSGAVQSCKVVGTSGDMQPPFGCEEARAERYEASAPRGSEPVRQGIMTVLVYGHEEYLS